MTNAAAIGYALLACKRLEFNKNELHELESMMYSIMDTISEGEAEEVYRQS